MSIIDRFHRVRGRRLSGGLPIGREPTVPSSGLRRERGSTTPSLPSRLGVRMLS